MKKMLLLLALTCFSVNKFFSQEIQQLTKKDTVVISSYIVGLGYNFVDDSGDVFKQLFNAANEWNAVSFPSRLSVGKYYKSGFGIEAIGTYNKYKAGKIVDGRVNLEDTDYYSFDTRLSYDLNELIGETAWFDPYAGIGLGYTDANTISRGTYNAVIGFRIWASERWGIDLNSSGKWAMGDKGASDHLQHAAGIVYRFGIEKGLSKKGEEKLAELLALEREKQRAQDSIAAYNKMKEQALLEKRLAEEKEKERLAALEKAKKDKEDNRKLQVASSIEKLGFVYFDLNSSYLNANAKMVLNALANILEQEETVALKIISHTDSRGSSTYNKWLSERRVKRTIEYLIARGIAADRLAAEGKGETSLLNECDDTVYCPEDKHQINRRSEFIITKI